MTKLTISILANFVANDLSESLEYWLAELGLIGQIYYAQPDQVIQQLLDPPSIMVSSDFTVLLVQLERWLLGDDVRLTGFSRNIQDFAEAVQHAARQTDKGAFIVILCPNSDTFGAAIETSEMETRLSRALALIPGVDVTTTSDIAYLYPIEDYSSYFDPFTDEQAQIPYTRLCFAMLGTLVARRIRTLTSPDRKVIAVDCDNTLWEGLCGDGPPAVQVTPRCKLIQNFLIKQSTSGRLICLISKNDESDVLAVFARHPDMLLKREHLTAWKINWNRKPDNLRSLSEQLGLSIDSFLFLDDDPMQCDEMRMVLPQVKTFLTPATYSETTRFLRETWEFDLKALTEEDRKRKVYYQQNAERERARQLGGSLHEFLSSLELTIDLAGLCEEDLRRVSQLTQRTNQFNLNGIGRSASELWAIVHGGEKKCVTVRARDRFGDYGLIGVMIYYFLGEFLVIDALLLSCRALGKGIEEILLTWLARKAATAGVTQLALEYRHTGRNGAMRALLDSLGICLTETPCILPVDRCFTQLAPHVTPCHLSVDERVR